MFIPRPRAVAPWRGTASPQLPEILTRRLGLGTLPQRLSRDRAGSQDPSPGGVVPSGTSLEGAGRHRQEAQREVGWRGAALRPWVTPARSCRDMGGPSLGRSGCVRVSPTRRGCTAQWLRVCGGW